MGKGCSKGAPRPADGEDRKRYERLMVARYALPVGILIKVFNFSYRPIQLADTGDVLFISFFINTDKTFVQIILVSGN